jgi:hypothetical protein
MCRTIAATNVATELNWGKPPYAAIRIDFFLIKQSRELSAGEPFFPSIDSLCPRHEVSTNCDAPVSAGMANGKILLCIGETVNQIEIFS